MATVGVKALNGLVLKVMFDILVPSMILLYYLSHC